MPDISHFLTVHVVVSRSSLRLLNPMPFGAFPINVTGRSQVSDYEILLAPLYRPNAIRHPDPTLRLLLR
jgi:hypothetical protein